MGFLDDITKAAKAVNKASRTINSVTRAGKTVTKTVKKAGDILDGDNSSKTKTTRKKSTSSKTSSGKTSSNKTTTKETTEKTPPAEEKKKVPKERVKKVVAKKDVRLSDKSTKIVIDSLPMSFDEFKALQQASLSTPFDTAALSLLAFTFYQGRSELSTSMLEYLKGPAGFDEETVSYIASSIEICAYAPRSYFVGATRENDYTPSMPYTVEIFEGSDSYEEEGYAVLYVKSSGTADPRALKMRQTKSGEWYLWDQDVLEPIDPPEKNDVWV